MESSNHLNTSARVSCLWAHIVAEVTAAANKKEPSNSIPNSWYSGREAKRLLEGSESLATFVGSAESVDSSGCVVIGGGLLGGKEVRNWMSVDRRYMPISCAKKSNRNAAPVVFEFDLTNRPTCHKTVRTLDKMMHPTKNKLICRASDATLSWLRGIFGNKAAKRAIR